MIDYDTMKPLAAGTDAPDFSLADVLSNETVTLNAHHGEIVVLNFWSGDCAWSRHYDADFAQRAAEWPAQGVRLFHISSNKNELPDAIRKQAADLGVVAPILHDPNNSIADDFGAMTTPHVFVIGADGRIAYQGAVDDRTFRQREATVNYVDEAINALREGQQPAVTESPAYGCAIVRVFES